MAIKCVNAAVDSAASYPSLPCSSVAGHKIVLLPVVINFNFSIVNLMQRHSVTVNLSHMKQRGTNFTHFCKEYFFSIKNGRGCRLGQDLRVSMYTKTQ